MLERGDYWLVVDGKMRIAHERAVNAEGIVIADLYRNHDDYHAGRVMQSGFTFVPCRVPFPATMGNA